MYFFRTRVSPVFVLVDTAALMKARTFPLFEEKSLAENINTIV